MDVRETAAGLLELTRPANAVAAGVLTFLGAYVAGGFGGELPAVAAAVGATVLATGAGNAINDYFDREIDRINRPDRAIPRGAVSPRAAVVLAVVLFGAAILLALALPALAVAIAVVNLLALVAYTELFKGTPGAGNALVAYLVGSTFLFGAAAVGDVRPAAVLFALAALATFSREVIKDVEDMAGDREEGLNTLPIAVGRRRALVVGAAALVVSVLAIPLPYLYGPFGVAYLVLVVPAAAVMLAGAVRSFADPAAGQRRVKYGMFLATLAFVAGRGAVDLVGLVSG